MDRRTLIFALAVFIAYFGFNTYFNSQYETKIHAWNLEQRNKKSEKLQQLEDRIAQDTATPEELPLVTIYAEESETTKLAQAIQTDNTLFTTPWNAEPPPTVYVANKKYMLSQKLKNGNPLLIYQSNPEESLPFGNLPDIGSRELQVVTFRQNSIPNIQLGEYADGTFSIAAERVEAIKKELDPKYIQTIAPKASSLVLMASGKEFLPVGFYQGENHSFTPFEDIPSLHGTSATIHGKSSQEFYVLQNEYQQLVISNVGGALIEINLPFSAKADPLSVVKPIDFDTEMVKEHPYNARFPSNPYFTPGQNPEGPFIEHQEGVLGGYYPLLRRDLKETGKWKSVQINPRYYALNILSEQPEVAELIYTVKHFDQNSLILEAQQKRRKITKSFSFPKDKSAPYTFNFSVKIEGDKNGLWISSGIPEVELFSGTPEPILKYRITRNQKAAVEMISLPKESTTNSSIHPDWLCNSNGFFGIIMDPLNDVTEGFKAAYISGKTVPSRITEIDQNYDRFQAENLPGYQLLMPYKASQKGMNLRIFAGPFSDRVLKTVDNIYADPSTGYTPDYVACQSYHGFFSVISEPFAKFLFVLMKFFHSLTHSWGLSIILLTVALRIMMYPLNAWSTKSMLGMQQIAPQVAAIQERNKKDPKKAQLEIMELYRERGVNPISGCFPMLIQMPFLIGMFDLLKTTFELRGASFIPGWIDNLAAPDVLFSWGTPLFFIGNQFHLLPFLLGGVMFLQQRMSSPAPANAAEMTEQQRQQRAMGTLMPIIFTFMFYHFPSGLNIYWLSSMLLGMLQQWWMQRKMVKTAGIFPSEIIVPKNKKKAER